MGDKINSDQFFDLITKEELSWQSIIYDLVRTEQLDPWDIEIGILAERYLQVIQQLEEADFFISSKVLLACALLLRLKSEILVNEFIQNLNNELFGRKEEEIQKEIQKIFINPDELPELVLKTPLARPKKVTLQELINSLNKAIETETRRIKRKVKTHQTRKLAELLMPQTTQIPLKVRIKRIIKLISFYINETNKEVGFSKIAPTRDEKIASLSPILHLSNEGKIYLFQEQPFEEIFIHTQPFQEPSFEVEQQ